MTVKRNIAANFVGQTIASGLNLALVPVYIHYLSIEAYALIGLYSAVQVWLTLLDFGMTPTVSREMARFSAGAVTARSIRELLRSLEVIVFGVAITIAVTLTAASGFLASHWLRVGTLSVGAVGGGLSMIGVVVGLRFCESIYRSAIVGLEQQVWLSGAGIALGLMRGLGAVAVLTVIPTVQAFFVWQAFVSIVTLVAFAAKLYLALPKVEGPVRFSLFALREVRTFAGGMFGVTFLAVLLTQTDKLLLSRMLPLDQLGYYLLASSVATVMYMVIGPVTQAIYPALVRLVAETAVDRLSRAYHSAAQVISVLLAPFVSLLAVFPRGILYTWSGNSMLADRTAPILAILAIGTFLNALMQVPYQLQLADGWTSLGLKINSVAVLILVPALIVAVPIYGPLAAATIWIILNSGYLLVGIPILHRRLLRGEMRKWVVEDVVLPVVGAATVVLVAAQMAPAQNDSRLIWLAFLGLVGSISAVCAVACAPIIRERAVDAFRVALTSNRRA
jgi:O-antigen/teichoic acid export membrane protein